MFALVVDDFGVDRVGKEHVKYLTDALRQHCDVTEDWKGDKLIGIYLYWDYIKRAVRLSIKNHIKQLMMSFIH